MLGLGLFKVEKLIRVAKAGVAKQQNDKPFNTRTHLTRLAEQIVKGNNEPHLFFFLLNVLNNGQ